MATAVPEPEHAIARAAAHARGPGPDRRRRAHPGRRACREARPQRQQQHHPEAGAATADEHAAFAAVARATAADSVDTQVESATDGGVY